HNLLSDLLTAAILVGVVGLWARRFFTGLGRRTFSFNARTLLHEAVLKGKISTDSAIVSGFITFHVGMRLLGQGYKVLAEGPDAFQPFATALAGLLDFSGATPGGIEVARHITFWGALGSILLFLPYFARTKHLHLIAAPVNYAVTRSEGSGTLPAVNLEGADFGAARLEDLSWPRLLDAYACIQCNRCQDACPASQTGKSLSPSALEINKRMELNGLQNQHGDPFTLRPSGFVTGGPSPRPLLEFAISDEAAWACTTCGACIYVCPVADQPMLDIVEIRRERVLMSGEFPRLLQNTFTNLERHGNPWGLSNEKRMDWAEGLGVPTVAENPRPDVLFWVGCAGAFDEQAQPVSRAFATLLNAAGVNYAVLGTRERCTGDSARRAGNEYLFAQLAEQNIGTLNEVGAPLIVTTCPHCFNTLKNEYPQLGGNYRVQHHTEFLAGLMSERRLPPLAGAAGEPVTFHDPCYLSRHNGLTAEPRAVLAASGVNVTEMERREERSFCCGAGGAQFFKEEEPGDERISDNRLREAAATLGEGGGTVAVACPFCKSMLKSSPVAAATGLDVRDVAELAAERLATTERSIGLRLRA
ncbi:MAG TPA: (Fe-S)-binding protein, partial [Deinococcales bacterium]|nr:(Fe-S)-binding protein [Deinococcales bacterium]